MVLQSFNNFDLLVKRLINFSIVFFVNNYLSGKTRELSVNASFEVYRVSLYFESFLKIFM